MHDNDNMKKISWSKVPKIENFMRMVVVCIVESTMHLV